LTNIFKISFDLLIFHSDSGMILAIFIAVMMETSKFRNELTASPGLVEAGTDLGIENPSGASN